MLVVAPALVVGPTWPSGVYPAEYVLSGTL